MSTITENEAPDPRGSLKAGRALGLLSSEIEAKRMTLADAIETAWLSPELCLDADEIDYVTDKLRAEYSKRPRKVFRVKGDKSCQ